MIDLPTRRAKAIVAVVVAAMVSVHFVRGVGLLADRPRTGAAITVCCVGIFVLQLRYLGQRFLNLWFLALEALLSYTAIGFGASIGLLCVLLGAMLLERFLVAAILVFGSAAWIDGIREEGLRNTTDQTLLVAIGGLALYGITRLAFLVQDAHDTRLTLAMAAVADERLQIAAELDAELAQGLATIQELATAAVAAGTDFARSADATDEILSVARQSLASARGAAADFRSMSLAPEATSAKALLASAGIAAEVRVDHTEPLGPAGALLAIVLREAVTDVVRRHTANSCLVETAEHDGRITLRVTNDGVRTTALGADPLEDLATRVTEAGGRFTTGLKRDGRFVVEASVATPPASAADRRDSQPARAGTGPEADITAGLFYFFLVALTLRVLLYVPLDLSAVAIPCLAIVCYLQIHFSVHDATRWARPALVLLAAIGFIPLHWMGRNWIAIPGFLAGVIPMAFAGGIAVPLVVGTATLSALISSPGAALDTLISGAIIYGMLRQARLIRELRDAAAALARAAVVQERLRAARDLHDLLGHSLAAITLKCELAKRLPDPAEQLADIAVIAGRAQADLRTVTGAASSLTFESELESAGSVLAAAAVKPEIEPADAPLPEESGDVLSAVLREAVTNVLRHSTARNCRIAVVVRPGSIRLEVENDGAPPDVTPPGSGIGNLTVRLAELGGTLTAGPDDGWYLLAAELPMPDAAPATASPSHERSAPRQSDSAR